MSERASGKSQTREGSSRSKYICVILSIKLLSDLRLIGFQRGLLYLHHNSMLSRSVSLLGSRTRTACCRIPRLPYTRIPRKPVVPARQGYSSKNCRTARSQNGEAADAGGSPKQQEGKAASLGAGQTAAESGGATPHQHEQHAGHQQHGKHGGQDQHHDGAHGAAHQLQHRAAEKMTFQLLEKVRSRPLRTLLDAEPSTGLII